jgi:hypothetical protein
MNRIRRIADFDAVLVHPRSTWVDTAVQVALRNPGGPRDAYEKPIQMAVEAGDLDWAEDAIMNAMQQAETTRDTSWMMRLNNIKRNILGSAA